MCVESQPEELFLVLECHGQEIPYMEAQKEQPNIFRSYLNIAVFCEKVLFESGNVISLIRVVDRFLLQGAEAEMGNRVIKCWMVILFKSGFLRGKQHIRIRPKSPTGKDLPGMEFPALFEG